MRLTTTQLFTKCLQEGDVSWLRRINPRMLGEVDAIIYEEVFRQLKLYNEVPHIDAVVNETENLFIPHSCDFNVGYIFDKVTHDLRENYIKYRMSQEKNPHRPEFLEELIDITKVSQSDIIRYNDVLPDEYFTDQKRLTCEIPFIKENIGKIIGSDYIVIVGRMKNQKTHMSRLVLFDLLRQGYNGLLFTNEISNREYAAQLDAIIAGVHLKDGFNPKIFRSFETNESITASLNSVYEYRRSDLGLADFAGKIHHPEEIIPIINSRQFPIDFILIDGAERMGTSALTSGDGAQSLKNVSNGLKDISLSTGIPIIIVTQSNRSREGKLNADSTTIGGSDAFGRDATVVFDCNVVPATNFGPNIESVTRVTPIVNRADSDTTVLVTTDWACMDINFYFDDNGGATDFELDLDAIESNEITDSLNVAKLLTHDPNS